MIKTLIIPNNIDFQILSSNIPNNYIIIIKGGNLQTPNNLQRFIKTNSNVYISDRTIISNKYTINLIKQTIHELLYWHFITISLPGIGAKVEKQDNNLLLKVKNTAHNFIIPNDINITIGVEGGLPVIKLKSQNKNLIDIFKNKILGSL